MGDLLARLRMPPSEAALLRQALMEELELASPDEPIAERLESWADSPESEVFSDLREGPELSRERAAEIVARGAEYLPDLIELECEETPSHEKWAAVWLVGAIGDPSAVPVLKALLVDPSSCDLATMLGSVADGAGRALAEMGPAGAEALFDLLARRQAREVILESMSTLATRQPDLRPRVASACLEVLADQAAPEMTRYLAVKTLIDLNWREALPVIERLLNRGQLDVDMIGPESIEEWRLAPAGLPQHPEADCLERFTPLHRRHVEAHRARLWRESRLGARSQERELQRDLAGLRSNAVGPKVGRNDPCPCGSGRKYKKCHLDTPLGTELRRRAAAAPWLTWGYALLPSEQLEQLGEEAVAAHLDILEMSGARLHEAAFQLTDDYLRWAAVGAARARGEHELEWLIARIAVSGQSHPALDYATILAVALSPRPLGLSELCVREKLVDLALEHGGLEQVWRVAAQTLFEDPTLGHALFHRIECSHAHNPWTAIAMADSMRGASSAEVVQALERAAATVRSGLASEPCPIEVVEAHLEDHRELLARGRLRRRQKWIWGDACAASAATPWWTSAGSASTSTAGCAPTWKTCRTSPPNGRLNTDRLSRVISTAAWSWPGRSPKDGRRGARTPPSPSWPPGCRKGCAGCCPTPRSRQRCGPPRA